VESAFVELSLIVAIATMVAAVARLLKQPLIIAYIVAGLLASPYFLGIMESAESVASFAQIGVALLLFIVGLQLDPKVLKKLGMVSLLTGLGQVVITGLLGYGLAYWLGFSGAAAWYLATAVTFSSTIIIMKLISDQGELNSLYGRLSVGLLLVQDLVVVIILLFISSSSANLGLGELIGGTIFKSLLLFLPLALFSIYFLPKIVRFMAGSRELLFLFSFGWAFLIAALFSYLDFSIEIGALTAGVALSVSPFKDEISSRIRPVRDFFVVLFFIWLGSQMIVTNLSSMILPIIVFSLFILIVEPLIVIAILGWLGFTRRTGFRTGLAMAQISEFSLILVALGVKNNQISGDIFSLVTIVGLITITVSSYLIMYSSRIYPFFSQALLFFERSRIRQEKIRLKRKQAEVILFGYNRIGHSLVEAFKRISRDFLIIDHDPEAIEDAEKDHFLSCYGDASDPELLDDLDLSRTKLVVSTIPDYKINSRLVTNIKEASKDIIVVVVAYQISEARELYQKGADYVLMPHFLGGEYGSRLIRLFGFQPRLYHEEKEKHFIELERRQREGHEHPLPEGERY